MRKLAIIALALLALAVSGTAGAHVVDYYSGPRYFENADYGAKVFPASNSAAWTNAWYDSIEAAADRWNNLQSGDSIHFTLQRGDLWPESGCTFGSTRNTVRRLSIDGVGGTYGVTTRCNYGDPLNHFYMRLDTGEPWHQGSGDDNVYNTVSARGILTHEFGHATGFVGHFDEPCSGSQLAYWHTMCQGNPGGDKDEAWRLVTLEEHDVHEFLDEY